MQSRVAAKKDRQVRSFPKVRPNSLPVSDNEKEWILKNLLESLQELRSGRAVNYPVVAGHRDAHHLTNDQLVVSHDRFRRHRRCSGD